MEKEFVPYKEALALKELGFDEVCHGQYDNGSEYKFIGMKFRNSDSKNSVICALPLWQQAFRWFREKQDLQSHISPKLSYPDGFITGIEYYYSVLDSKGDYSDDGVYSYEEAQLACLRKLIKIVKDGKIS